MQYVLQVAEIITTTKCLCRKLSGVAVEYHLTSRNHSYGTEVQDIGLEAIGSYVCADVPLQCLCGIGNVTTQEHGPHMVARLLKSGRLIFVQVGSKFLVCGVLKNKHAVSHDRSILCFIVRISAPYIHQRKCADVRKCFLVFLLGTGSQ